MVATNSNGWPNGLGGIGGTATYVAGSPDVVVTGLQTLANVGAPGYIFGGRTTEDPSTHFRPGMQIITALSQAHQTGAMPKNAYALSLNSSTSGGTANIRMSANATFSKVYTISAVADQIGLFNTVENPTTGDRRALHGVTASFGVVGNDFVGMATTDHPVEGTSQLGANYFEHFSNTSLPTTINANVTPSMITTANVASTAIQDIIDMKAPNGYYRFPDSVLVGDQSLNTSRNNYLDSIPGFGLNIQWSGNGDTDKYGTQAQTAMTFQAFTDNALQSQSGFEDRAGPRVLLSSFTGNKNDAWQGWYPRAGQELGKFAWWSTTGESANPSTTTPPAAITAIASDDWDTDAKTSVDVIHYASSVTSSGTKLAFLTNQDSETSIASHSSKKIKFGQAGTINTDVRANAALVAEWANISSTGIQTPGVVTATGNVSGANLTTSGAVQGDNTVLKKYNETVVNLGSVSGDQSSALNATNGSIYTLTATGGITINTIANAVAGTSMMIKIIQDGTGSRALTSSMKFASGNKTLSAAAGAIDVINVVYDGTDYLASLTNGFS